MTEKTLPSSSITSPQGLIFSSNLEGRILTVRTSSLPSGYSRAVTIMPPTGVELTYNFRNGESIGYPGGDYNHLLSKLVMKDSSGNPVTGNPVYYDRLFEDGSWSRYSASTQLLLYFVNSDGRQISLEDKDVGLSVIRDSSGNLRQVKSQADGLADIVVTDQYKYQVFLYGPSGSGSFDTETGLWIPTGSPLSTWTIENPQRDSGYRHIVVTNSVNGADYVQDWLFTDSVNDWQVSLGGGLRVESISRLFNSDGTQMVRTFDIRNGSGTLLNRSSQIFKSFPWGGNSLVQKIVDPEGAKLSSSYSYYTDGSQTGKYGRTRLYTEPNGSWTAYDYDSQGRVSVEWTPFKDAPSSSSAEQSVAKYISYSPVDSNDVAETNDSRARTKETKVLGVSVSKTYYAFIKASTGYVEIEERCASPSASYGASGNLRTTKTYYPVSEGSPSSGRLKSVQRPDGTLDSYSYEYGVYTPAPSGPGSFAQDSSGLALRTSVVHGTTASPDGLQLKSMKNVSVSDQFANPVLSQTYVLGSSSWSLVKWTSKTFDQLHHTTAVESSDGTASSAIWSCCMKQSETTADGTQYVYSYDLRKRLLSTTKAGSGSQPDLVTSSTYNAMDRAVSGTVAGGTLSLSSSSSYDGADRIVSSVGQDGLTTSYAYSNGGRTETVTLPGGFTRITDHYLDGSLKSVTGTAVVPEYFNYGVNADGSRWTVVSYSSPSSPYFVKTTTDCLDRTVKTERPGWNGTITEQSYYNSLGQLVKTAKTGSADTLYSYDSLGNLVRAGLDVDGNGSLVLASTDRIQDSDTSFAQDGTGWWSITTSTVYGTDNSATGTTASVQKRLLTGLPNGVNAQSVSIDIHGAVTTSTTSIDRTNKTVTQSVTYPDSNVAAQTVVVNGLKTSERTKTNLTYSFSYDALGRQTGQTDPRTGTTVTAYNSLSQVSSITDPASNATTYAYESATGRKASETDALGNTTLYTYDAG